MTVLGMEYSRLWQGNGRRGSPFAASCLERLIDVIALSPLFCHDVEGDAHAGAPMRQLDIKGYYDFISKNSTKPT